eukprot:2162259-Pleurochrysis_carterae.AAC.1
MKQIEAEREIATTVVKVLHMYKVLQPDKTWVWKTKEELRGHFTHLDANKVTTNKAGNETSKPYWVIKEILDCPRKIKLILHYKMEAIYPPPLQAPPGALNVWEPYACYSYKGL